MKYCWFKKMAGNLQFTSVHDGWCVIRYLGYPANLSGVRSGVNPLRLAGHTQLLAGVFGERWGEPLLITLGIQLPTRIQIFFRFLSTATPWMPKFQSPFCRA